jgi:hypothetical protein
MVSRFPFSPLTIVKKKLNDDDLFIDKRREEEKKKKKKKKTQPTRSIVFFFSAVCFCHIATSNITEKPGTSFFSSVLLNEC